MHDAGQIQELFEVELLASRFSGEPANLYEPFNYFLTLGGKRLRPVMLLMAAELFGMEVKAAIPQAIAIELFHNFTLIHDDIMDHAPLRRGKPTVHEKFGETLAILSGDAMLVYAYEYLIRTNDSLCSKLVSTFNQCAIKVCEGQQMDMNYENAALVTVEDYLKMIELKTAVLLGTSLKIGALIGGATGNDCDHIYEFGNHLGIAFQLKDDLLDAFGDSAKTGKQAGGDIIQNKKTFLLLQALKRADKVTREEIMSWQTVDDSNHSAKVQGILRIYRALEVDRITQDLSDQHFFKAIEALEKINMPQARMRPLYDLSTSLMNREH